MNNKLFIFLLSIPFALVLTMCKTQPQDLVLKPPMNWEQVVAVAQKYGLQDSINQESHGALMHMAPDVLEKHMVEMKRSADSDREMVLFFEKNKDIRTFDDYCKLMDALPNFKRSAVEAEGGEEKYKQWVESRRNIKWHIYRDPKGMLTWVRPEDDNRGIPIPGERIDNKVR